MKIKLAISILFLWCAILYGREFTDQFTQEFGGLAYLSVSNDSYENDTNRYSRILLNTSPFYHFYIFRYLYVGPSIYYEYQDDKVENVYDTKSNRFALGIDAGVAIANKYNLIPYLQFNYSAGIYSYTSVSSTNSTNDKSKIDENDNQFGIDLGIKIVISKHISINLSTGYTYYYTKGSSDYFNNNIQQNHDLLKTKSNNFRIINIGLAGLLF
jgi:hypothetical protein